MKDYHLSRVLLSTNDLELRSYIVLPRLINTSKPGNDAAINLSVIANPCLIIKNTKNAYDPNRGYKNSYTMNIRNHRMTKRFFATVINWFENPKMQNLFYVTNGELQFNYDYKDLFATIPLTKYTESVLEARPTLVINDRKREEGVALCVNSSSNESILTWREFEACADIVMNFDFVTEALLLSNSFKIACDTKRVTTPEQERMEKRGSGKSPFSK